MRFVVSVNSLAFPFPRQISHHRIPMLRRCLVWRSTALHSSSAPFVDNVLQLIKLHLAHRNAASDRNNTACRAIENEFMREVELFRPCFTMNASLTVASHYSKKLYAALHYFGLDDDPLVRQLNLLMGRESMRRMTHHASRARSGMFRGVSAGHASHAATSTSSSSRSSTSSRNMPSVFTSLDESVVTTLPTELPHPPQVNRSVPLREGAVKIPLRYRGHWVLQEPDIAITRKERREDPW